MTNPTLFWNTDSTDASLDIGKRQEFGDRFKLLNLLEEGGFGQVWRAKDLWLKQEVALKISDSEMSNEIILLRKLPRDRYISIYDYIKDEESQNVAYAMEVLESPWMTLDEYHSSKIKPNFSRGNYIQGLRISLFIIIDILTSLEYLHGQKYKKKDRWCHADIKPNNLYGHSKKAAKLVNNLQWGDVFSPVTKIGDLGLATKMGSTLNGGTMGFMAPEQRRGVKNVSPATDLFAVGQTLVTLINGKPFQDNSLRVNKIRDNLSNIIPSKYIISRLVAIIHQMTNRSSPGLRPSAKEAIKKLQSVVNSEVDWLIFLVFSEEETGLTLADAALSLFEKHKVSKGWRNLTLDREKEMKSLVRSAYRREILSREGHQYSIKT